MNAVAVLQTALNSTQFILTTYLSDLEDEALLVRTVPGANHTAWQLGHLIAAEKALVEGTLPDAGYPALPEGFEQLHNKKNADDEDASHFLNKAEYLDWFNKMRKHTIDIVGGLTEADLEKATAGPMAKFAPTLGALLVLVSNHTLMHAGQVAVLRRKLGKPVLI